MDLNSDIPDDLPPTQALPQFTEEGLPVSQGIRGAPAPAATPAPTPHRSLTPPQGAGPSPDNLAARLSGGAAAPPRRAVSAVKDPDRPTIMAMGPPPSSKPWGIIIGGVVAGLALVGGIAFWALSGDPPPPEAPPAPPAPVELSWEERLNEQLSSASAMLPAAEGTEALEESHYIAAGPEGLHSHLGNIPGLPSSQQPKGSLASDERGAWSRPVFQALSKQPTPPSANALFALALDSQVPFHVSLRLAYAAKRAGYAIQGIVAQRTEAAGKLGLLSFKIKDLKDPFPARGALALRIGTLGFNVAVRDGQNKVISAGNPRIPRKEKNNNLDFFALEKRLNALSAAHGEVSEVVFYPAPKMSIEDGVRILSMLAMSRFNQIWIQLPR